MAPFLSRESPNQVEHAHALLRGCLACATTVMLVLSWPLWAGGTEIPAVPFLASVPQIGARPLAQALAVALCLCVIGTGFTRSWRSFTVLAACLFLVSWIQDQHRFQTWSYQFAVVGMFLVLLPRREGLRYAGFWYVATYAHSALSKLDASFCDELGLVFLQTALAPLSLSLSPLQWPRAWRVVAVLAMPLGELGVALALSSPRIRWLGLWGATFLHVALLGVLGPFGLGHSAIVLCWNVAMLVETWVVFGTGWERAADRDAERVVAAWPRRLVATALLLVGVLVPLGERWEWCDAWPGHALYASHVAGLSVEIHESELRRYPESVRRHVATTSESPWKRLDLTGWSREQRGTPVYPQVRAGLGLAEGLAARYGERGLIRVVERGTASLWTGRRPRTEWLGLDTVRRRGDRFLLNAHPAGTGAGSSPRGTAATSAEPSRTTPSE